MILGFCWLLLRSFGPHPDHTQHKEIVDSLSFESNLLGWVKDELQDTGIELKEWNNR